ncbi:MAG: hypothetical protein GYB67_05370 [Chloroflexi bacterium]|nr:hypothetical protein [Chloroflexota bacterium]
MTIEMNEIRAALDAAIAANDATDLERLLTDHAYLPGGEPNFALIEGFAAQVGAVVAAPNPPETFLEALLDGWAALSPAAVPNDNPRAILPAAAARSYGAVAAARPEWWSAEVGKLECCAADPRPLVRQNVVRALNDARPLADAVAAQGDPAARIAAVTKQLEASETA